MLKTCPDPVDVQDIHFKLHCSLKIFDNSELETFPNNHSLVSCASRYGLLFVGTNTDLLKVIQLKTVENYNPKDKDISNFPRRNVPLPSVPKHVCVNCDSTILAVVVEKDNCPTVIFYDVLSFYKQNINVIKEVRLSASPGVYAAEVNWNPALPNIFTACKSDRSLGIYEIKDNSVDINELPQAAETTSFCWSPKGKQIAVGSKNGNITQYKPDLKAVKVINGPIFETAHSLISLCWVSNYQFIGVYQAAEQDGQAKLLVIDAPKAGETSYTNYDDVCYSGSNRIPQFYLILLQHWNMLLIASSNSMELGLLGAVSEVWTQWNVPDFARAELPLAADKQDTLPVGMALDISNTKPLPWGEGSLPPCPYLLLFSHHGVLYFFNIVNLKDGSPSICCPPDSVSDMSGLRQFVVETKQIEASSTPQQSQLSFSFGAPQPQLPIQPSTLITPQPTLPFQTPQTTFSFAKPIPTQPLSPFGAPPTSAPLTTSLFGKPGDNKPLFGGSQVTLTPIKPLQPDVASSPPIFGNPSISLTPVSKPQSVNNEKYSSIFSALKAPSSVPVPEIKPIIMSSQNPKPESPVNVPQESAVPEIPKSVVLDIPRPNVDVKTAYDEKVKVETDALLAKMVKDECVALESELKALLHQGRRINVNIGRDEEKIKMVEDLKSLKEFIKEIVDVSLAESSEVHALKQNLILSWAWYEEALSRYNVSKNETMTILLKCQPLDSAAIKRQTDIRKIIHYLESQLYQASKALDEQWDLFQDYAKKTYRVQMPTMEAIFQSMVRQNAVLQKQSYIVKYINGQLKHKKSSSTSPSLFLSLNNSDKLEESLARLQLDPDDGHRIFYEEAIERGKHLSFSKRNKLRNLLKNHEVSHVTAAKPQLNASISSIKSPTAKNKHVFSILGARMSPIPKSSVSKTLKFLESTPVKFVNEIKPTTVPPNTPAQPDPSKTFTFKGLEKSNAITPPSLPKSAPLLSQNQMSNSSAFVPTTPTSKTFLVPQVSAAASTTLSFNYSSKQDPSSASVITITNPSQISFGSGISVTPIAGKKPESVPTVSTTKATFNFAASGNNFSPKIDVNATAAPFSPPQASKPLFNPSTLPSFAADTTQSLFSFGKTTSAAATTSTIKSAPSNLLSTTSTTISTPQTTFSFGKTTASIISPADSTVVKPTIKLAPVTAISTKPALFSTTPSDTASTISSTSISTTLVSPSAISTSKPINFGTTTPSTTNKIILPTTSFNFGGGQSSSSLLSGAITTTTTSLFGSITTPSVVSSIFGSKPTVSVDSTTMSTFDIGKSISSSTIVSTTAKSPAIFSATTLPATSTTKSIFDTAASPLISSTTTSTSTVSSTPSIFGSSTPPISSTPSIFGSSTLPATNASIFSSGTPPASSTKPLFGTNSSVNTTPTNIGSIFGASTISTPTATITPSIFSNTTLKNTGTPSSPGSIFGGTSVVISASSTSSTTPAAVSSSTNEDSKVSTAATQASIFATSTAAPATTKSSIFGEAPSFGAAPTSTSSVFGSPATTTQASIFSTPATSSQPSIFGTLTSTSQSSAFGSSTTNAPTPVFGGSVTTTQSSIFGGNTASAGAPVFGNAATTTQASIFGASTTGTASVFGSTPPTTQTSIFGAPSSSSGSIFGGTPTTQASIFGSSSPTSTQASIFGSAVSSTSSNSVFGGADTTSAFGTSFSQPTSIFGGKTTANNFSGGFDNPSTFGTTPTTTAAFTQPAPFGNTPGSVFGTPATSSSVFGSDGSTFGAVSSSGSVFGSATSSFSFASAANTGSSLGFGDLNVGSGTPASGGSIFGGSPSFGQTAPNPFARATDQKPPFGGSTSTFGAPPSTTSAAFGSNTGSIFGSNTQNAFGGSTSFGSPSGFGQQSNFGQTSGGFSNNAAFGSNQPGPFSGGGVGVGQTGFGSPGNFQKQPAGFGGAPVFGGSPQSSFGASPSFGGSPSFGNAPAFGSPPKVFGSATPVAPNFTQSTGSASPGFGNLATQNTVGFGSLAQQAATPTSSFSGGSSFSSWR